jgi:hypothetical protein
MAKVMNWPLQSFIFCSQWIMIIVVSYASNLCAIFMLFLGLKVEHGDGTYDTCVA